MRYAFLALLTVLFFEAGQSLAQGLPATQPAALSPAPAFFQHNLVEAYEIQGQRNPAWDDDARKVLQFSARRWAARVEDPDTTWQIGFYGERALDAGCDDPSVLYSVLRAGVDLHAHVDPGLLTRLDESVGKSNCAPFIKLFSYVRLTGFVNQMTTEANAAALMRRLIQGALDNLPAVASQQDFPQEPLAQVCEDLTDAGMSLDGDRKPTIDKIYDILSKTAPQSPVADLFEAHAYRDYAWDARGVGFANAVSADGWRLMGARLDVAQEACQSILAKDPHNSAASAEMIGIELGQDVDRGEMERNFQNAIRDDPDNYLAYDRKLYYLTPKWHGTIQDQIDFGRECLATKRWDARIPFLLLESQEHMLEGRFTEVCRDPNNAAERQRATEQVLSELYQQQPARWQDVKDLYEGYLAHNPNAVSDRLKYATAAVLAGDLDLAVQEILALRANTDPGLKNEVNTCERYVGLGHPLCLRGLIKLASGDANGGLADEQQFLKLFPGDEIEIYGHLWAWIAQSRLGQKDLADRDLSAYVKTLPSPGQNPWQQTTASFFLGNTSEADYLAKAAGSDPKERDGNLCEAWYYAGQSHLIAGDKAKAKEYFEKCEQTNQTGFFEYKAAEAELAAMDK